MVAELICSGSLYFLVYVLTELGVPNRSGTVSITVAKVLERLPPDAGRFPVARDFPL